MLIEDALMIIVRQRVAELRQSMVTVRRLSSRPRGETVSHLGTLVHWIRRTASSVQPAEPSER